MLQRPVPGLSDSQVSEELRYWHTELGGLYGELRRPFSSLLLKLTKWGGLALAVAGIPAAFAGALIGFPIAAGGLAAGVFGHLLAQRKEVRDDDLGIRVGLIMRRLQEIEDLRVQRRKQP